MTLVIQSSSPSSSSSIQYCVSNRSMPPSPVHDGSYQQPAVHLSPTSLINHPNTALEPIPLQQRFYLEDTDEERGGERKGSRWFEEDADGGSVLALFVSQLRRSVFGRSSLSEDSSSMNPISSYSSSCSDMEIGVPTNVRHVAHVTFDRFNGFLGLPLEFEPEVPRRPPSASTTVFGVSTNSMQLSFDSRGNSVPTILLMMQRRLYTLGGLQAEGIFRITAGSDQEEYVRQQLNRGVVPEDADVHCLAGLIKTWFRELPTGILDCLSPEVLKESQTEDECGDLTRHLPPTEAALLDWTVNLMADIAQLEHLNKMNAHNVAVVFAPNMTRVLDPLTALMHAVHVMNFLKTLIARTLRKREGSALDQDTSKYSWDKNVTCGPSQTILEENNDTDCKVYTHRDSITHENPHDLERHFPQLRDDNDSITEEGQVQSPVFPNFIENVIPRGCDNHYPFVVSDKMNKKGGGVGGAGGVDGGDDGVTRSGSRGVGTDHTRESSPGNYKSCNVVRIRNKQSSWEVFS